MICCGSTGAESCRIDGCLKIKPNVDKTGGKNSIWVQQGEQLSIIIIIIVLSSTNNNNNNNRSHWRRLITMRTSSQRLAAVRKSEAMLLASVNCSNLCLNRGSYLPAHHHNTSVKSYSPSWTDSDCEGLNCILTPLNYIKWWQRLICSVAKAQ